jgi:acetyl esterase/lipase
VTGETGWACRPAVPFATWPGHRPVELDLHWPRAGTGPFPVVVLVHGGGWAAGSRRSFGPAFDGAPEPLAGRIARGGYVVAAVDYRLSGEAVFPAPLDDLRAAIAWLGEHAAEVGGDPARTVLWGESAGGHLAALAGLTGADDAATRVRGVVAWYAPSDLTTMSAQARDDAVVRASDPGSRESLLLGGPVDENGALAVSASPVSHVHAGAPPFLLVHGDADRFVPVGQSRQLHEALTGVGVPVQLVEVAGADHLWRGAADVGEVLDRSLRFVAEVTRG